MFAKFGIAQIFIGDNGPEFKVFAKKSDFQNDTFSGLEGRTIQTLKKTKKSNQDTYLAILSLQTIPFNDVSPPAI